MAELIAGAILGAAVGELLKDVIFLAQMASRCKKNFKQLLVTLDSVSLLLDDVVKSTTIGNETCDVWLKSIHDLLKNAKTIVETCSMKKWTNQINYLQRAKLSAEIIAIDIQIQRKLLESNLITLCTVQKMENQGRLQPSTISSTVQSIGETMENQGRLQPSTISSTVQSIGETEMLNIPTMIVPFIANPFERLKNKIINGVDGMDVPLIIGLKGRGGCGKTLLAKMVNNDEDIQKEYKGSILWITIGHDATIPSIYLTMAKMLHDHIYERDYIHRNLEDQREHLIRVLQKKKVLLILDDVWDRFPSHNRAMIEWLDVAKGQGSIILITTRDVSVLKRVKCIDMVDVQSLSLEDSWRLFCMHAFVSMKPPSIPIEAIAKNVCKQCDGLPLALIVIGSAMWKKIDEREWCNTLNYLEGSTKMIHSKFVEKELEHKLYSHLQYSYDDLDDTSQKCFLHFAAFPEDDQISTSLLCDIWHAQNLFDSRNAQESRDIGISTLIDLADRSLIDMSEDGKYVQIHDVLRDLANHILKKAKPDEWASKCYFQVGKAFKTFPTIGKHVKIVSLIGCTFREFSNNLELPILQVCLLSKISCANGINRLVIPKGFFSSMKDLQLLIIPESNGVEVKLLNLIGLSSLMHLDLRDLSSLTDVTESIKELKSLIHLNLRGCLYLTKLPEVVNGLKSLMHLDLQRCSSLTKLPKSINEMKSLMHLDLSGCSSLMELPESIKELKSLTYLYLRGCSSLTVLPKSIKELKSLEHLDFSWCLSLMEFPQCIKELKSLTYFNFQGCSSLMKLPEDIKELKFLTHLNLIYYTSLMEIPEGIKEMKSLTHLDLRFCSSLIKLPEGIKELKSFIHLDLSWCSSLIKLPESIKELKLLTHLYLRGCSSLMELPESIKELKSLTHLDLQRCSSLTKLPEGIKELKSLTHLDLQGCSSLTELPESVKELKSLTYLDLSWCSSLTKLPKDMKELKSLTHLYLSRCSSLKELPNGIKEIKSLEHLDLL